VSPGKETKKMAAIARGKLINPCNRTKPSVPTWIVMGKQIGHIFLVIAYAVVEFFFLVKGVYTLNHSQIDWYAVPQQVST
jgi:hypothetical protein